MFFHSTHSAVLSPLAALLGSATITARAPAREEQAWVQRARQGDEAAYTWLLAQNRDRVIRLARATLGRNADAEDAAQEAFIRAFRNIAQLQPDGSFYSWISKITVRVCIDRMRLRSWFGFKSTSATDILSDDPAESAQTGIVVRDLLARLSPPMRAALVLREMDGLEYDEIAVALSIPVGTVRSRLNAARAQFRQLWETEVGDDE